MNIRDYITTTLKCVCQSIGNTYNTLNELGIHLYDSNRGWIYGYTIYYRENQLFPMYLAYSKDNYYNNYIVYTINNEQELKEARNLIINNDFTKFTDKFSVKKVNEFSPNMLNDNNIIWYFYDYNNNDYLITLA